MSRKWLKSLDVELIIPSNSLSYLPFSPEPPSTWSYNTDLYLFLFNLFNVGSEVINEHVETQPIDYSFYSVVMYEEGKDRLKETQIEFALNARKARLPLSFDRAIEQGLAELAAQKYPHIPPTKVLKEHTTEILAAGYQHQLGALPEFWDDSDFGLMPDFAVARHMPR